MSYENITLFDYPLFFVLFCCCANLTTYLANFILCSLIKLYQRLRYYTNYRNKNSYKVRYRQIYTLKICSSYTNENILVSKNVNYTLKLFHIVYHNSYSLKLHVFIPSQLGIFIPPCASYSCSLYILLVISNIMCLLYKACLYSCFPL